MNIEELKATKIQVQVLEEILNYKDKEIERLNNIIKDGINEELKKELDEILKCNQRQANKINKAIEIIKNLLCSLNELNQENNTHQLAFIIDSLENIEEILKGDNKRTKR